MTATATISSPAYAARMRTLALRDSIDHARRAASATLAAGVGERDHARASILIDANRRLQLVLRELQGLV